MFSCKIVTFHTRDILVIAAVILWKQLLYVWCENKQSQNHDPASFA